MTQEITVYSVRDVETMADAVAKSKLFGIQTKEQAVALMLVAQAEGRHPALAARDYNIIQGRPAKTSEAMMRDFMEGGGSVEWHQLSDALADATFSHPQGGSVRITWDLKRAQNAGLGGKDNWKKWPRQMLRARCISEGVRTIFPRATGGMYTPEEVKEFEPSRQMRDVTPAPVAVEQVKAAVAKTNGDRNAAPQQASAEPPAETQEGAPHDVETGEIIETELQALQRRAEAIAQKRGTIDLEAWFKDDLSPDEKRLLRSDAATWDAIKNAAAVTDKTPSLLGAA